MKKLLVIALGMLAALVLLEGGLRLAAFVELRRSEPRAKVNSHPIRILALGNSYTQGVGARPGESYPDQLQKLLDARYPGQAAVFNEGAANANTRQLLRALPRQLQRYDPTIVVVMAGQPNHWNPYGYGAYLQEAHLTAARPWLYRLHDFLYPVRVFRLLFTLSDALTKARETSEAKSVAFPNYPLRDRASIEATWINALDERWGRTITDAQAAEGVGVLSEYLDKHPDSALAALSLAALALRHNANPELAVAALSKCLAADPRRFRAPIYNFLRHSRAAAAFVKVPGYQAALAASSRGTPSGKDRERLLNWLGQGQLPFDESRPGNTERNMAFLRDAIRAEPGESMSTYELMMHLQRLKRWDGVVELAEQGIDANPAQSRYSLFRNLLDASHIVPGKRKDVDQYVERFRERYPSLSWLTNFVQDSDELPWVRFDLLRLHQLLQSRGIPLVLETYPPRRHLRERWPADTSILDVARETGVPLSDHYVRLASYFDEHGAKDSYYSFNVGSSDEHLNGRGYGIVAQDLFDTIQKAKLVP